VQALGQLNLPALEIGSSADLNVGENFVIAGYGGARNAVKAHFV